MEALYLRLILSVFSIYSGLLEKNKTRLCDHEKSRFNCVQFLYNYDGDSIKFKIPRIHPVFGKRIGVQLRGVDAPELKTSNSCEKALALKAKVFVTRQLEVANRIDLVLVVKSRYSNIAADVIADGISLSEQLLNNQLAVSSYQDANTSINWCRLIERWQ